MPWLSHDSLTGESIAVSWDKPAGDSCIEIDNHLAESFILGNEKIHDYMVIVSDNALKKKDVVQRLSRSFWSLKILDGSDSGMKITTKSNYVYVNLNNISNLKLMLFATMKNDPTWLISSWSLSKSVVNDDVITVECKNADNYSFYIGKG